MNKPERKEDLLFSILFFLFLAIGFLAENRLFLDVYWLIVPVLSFVLAHFCAALAFWESTNRQTFKRELLAGVIIITLVPLVMYSARLFLPIEQYEYVSPFLLSGMVVISIVIADLVSKRCFPESE